MINYKKVTYLALVASSLMTPLHGNQAMAKPAIYTELKNEFPNGYLMQQEEVKPETSLKPADQLEILKNSFSNKALNAEEKRSLTLQILSGNDSSAHASLDSMGRKDLELVNQASLHTIVNRTNSTLGEIVLAKELSNPVANIKELLNRQAIISQLSTNPSLFDKVDLALKELGNAEETYLSLWEKSDPIKDSFIQQLYYFNLLPSLNKSRLALGASNQMINALMAFAMAWEPVALSAALYMQTQEVRKVLKQNNLDDSLLATLQTTVNADIELFKKLPTGSKLYAAFMVGMLGFSKKQMFSVLKLKRDSALYLQRRLIGLASCINSLKAMNDIVIEEQLQGFETITELFDPNSKHSANLKNLIHTLTTNTFTGEASSFSRLGRVLVAETLTREVKNELRDALEAAGKLDALLSMTKLMREFKDKRVHYCFVEFTDNSLPSVALNEFWNPLVNPEVVVTNNVLLDDSTARNMILTGPNTGGKSTVIKGITLNIVLAQTFGIAAAQSMRLTPFKTIKTNINITDNVKDNLSLFAAEVSRAKEILNSMENLDSEFGFCVFDETFRGTAPDQAEKLSCWYAQELAKHKNVISLHATHYPTMIDLEQKAPSCKNYKVEIKKTNGSLERDYKLKEGSTLFNVAEDILIEQGLIR